MTATELKASAKDCVLLCTKCNTVALLRQPKSSLDWLLSLEPYACARCAARKRKFHFDWSLLAPVLLVYLVIPLLGYLVARSYLFNPQPVSAQSDIDALARTRTVSGGQLTAFEQMLTKKPKSTLDNAMIVRLWNARIGAEVIRQMIHTSIADFDLSPNAIIALHEEHVDERIILAMIDATYSGR
jgi:hypothetical protein